MKKILYSLIAILAMVMSSCSNDDIEVTTVSNITFELNPETVVSGLFEHHAGDLKALNKGTTLHVSLYIYDKDGKLVRKDGDTFAAYTQIMTSTQELETGSYTAVAITHITGEKDYWTFSDEENLNEFRIKDNNIVGGKSKILGIKVIDFTVDKDPRTVKIDIENAGAVAFVQMLNWNKYSNVTNYYLAGKQACDYVSFSNNKDIYYSLRSKDVYSYFLAYWNYNSESSSGIGYFFTFPIKKASMRFGAKTTDGKFIEIGNQLIDDIKIGETYWILYDFDTNEATWYDQTPSNQSMSNSKATDNITSDLHIKYSDEGVISFR